MRTDGLHRRYLEVRAATEALCRGLEREDYVVQSMPDASPVKWHLAHTTWFFETFVLAARAGYRAFRPEFGYLFNSYYEGAGERWPRAVRGLLSRPTVDEVFAYRRHVDAAMGERCDDDDAAEVITLGLHHEQQHQELILTDLKHALSLHPLGPAVRPADERAPGAEPLRWVSFAGGTASIGDAGDHFAFDNERPRHTTLLRPYRLASRLVTAGEYAAFIDDAGYRRPALWLSDGWATAAREGWHAPLYWRRDNRGWSLFTLAGWRPLRPDEPVAHMSFYEADAYARWAGARLPTEHEWEHASATGRSGLTQLFDECWQWTQSAYAPYPGYRPLAGVLGEYNGKFMCNQMVLRGASSVTPRSHVRLTYRNFFPPAARWQLTGIRLANDE